MKTPADYLQPFPREKVSILPTPLHRMDRLSDMTGCDLWIKRDDLTGFALSGNKTRKFDFLVADALRRGCDTMIGIGANQSNFCRILAGVGARWGFDVHLVLNGKKPEKPTGNLLADHMLKAVIHHVDTKDGAVRMQAAEALRDQLTAAGKRVYFMPPGGSTPVGTLGYAAGFGELLKDFQRLSLNVRHILHSSSSAGTQAGLVLGQAMSGWDGRIAGISVDVPAGALRDDVYRLASEAGALCGVPVDKNRVFTDDAYVGEGYGIPTDACREAVDLFARHEGIFLDYVYTGKGASGLLDYCRTGKIRPGETTVFIHTGGFIELFK